MAHRPVRTKQVPVMVEGGKNIDFRKMTIGTVHGGFTVVVCSWCGKNALKTGNDCYVHTGQEYKHRGMPALLDGKVCTILGAINRLHNKAEWSISALKNMDLTKGHFMGAYDRGIILLKGLRTAIGNVLRGIRGDGAPLPKRKGKRNEKGVSK
jgi:hypothetical protein